MTEIPHGERLARIETLLGVIDERTDRIEGKFDTLSEKVETNRNNITRLSVFHTLFAAIGSILAAVLGVRHG